MNTFAPPPPQPNASASPQMNYVPGGFWRRFLAVILDGIIMSVINMFITIPMACAKLAQYGTEQPIVSWHDGVSWLVSLVLGFIYLCWFYTKKGGTPGKLLLKLRVVDAQTGMFLTIGQTLLREIVGKWILNTITLFIGYIMAGLRQDKRGLHDLVAGTRVLKIES